MPKEAIPFSDFQQAAGAEHADFIDQLHTYLRDNGCVTTIKQAANGHVVSYVHKPTKRTVANYLFRKNMPMLRIYADHAPAYESILATLPPAMKDSIKTGGTCARLIDPTKCNSRCLQGFTFMLDGELQQKCRCHMGMTFFLDNESKPYLLDMMQREMQARLA